MTLLLLAAALVAWWQWGRGLSRQQLAAAASAIAGAVLAIKGSWAIGLPMILPAVWLLVQGGGLAPAPGGTMSREEAGRVLGVDPNADAETIRTAHRRLSARVHPDQGGSSELAASVNRARDILLAELRKR